MNKINCDVEPYVRVFNSRKEKIYYRNTVSDPIYTSLKRILSFYEKNLLQKELKIRVYSINVKKKFICLLKKQ